MSFGYSGFDRGNRYDDAHFERVSASNAETKALRQGLPEVESRPCLAGPVWGRLISTGHIVMVDGDLFAVIGDRSVYRKATLRVADDSPIFRRVIEQARCLQALYEKGLSDEDFDKVRATQARIEAFSSPLGVRPQDVIGFADLLKEGKVEACRMERAYQAA